MSDDPKSPAPSPDLPSPDPRPDLPPSLGKSPSSPSLPPPPASSSPASQAETAELVHKKRALVDSLDQIVEPLDAILTLMRDAWRGGVILLAFMALMVGVQVHTTLRMLAVEEQLNAIIASQKTLQQTATTVADKQTATQNALNQQSQITIEPSYGPDGSPTAIVVVKPPPAASQLPPVPLALSPVATTVATSPVSSMAAVVDSPPPRRPRPMPTATGASTATTQAYVPPPAPAPVKFE